MSLPRSSKQRYLSFIEGYKRRNLDNAIGPRLGKTEFASSQKTAAESSVPKEKAKPCDKPPECLRKYVCWLWRFRYAVALVFALALLCTGVQMIEPLFMRYVVDDVLLKPGLGLSARMARLNLAGAMFLVVITISSLVSTLRDYRQRILNARVMLALRRSLLERLLHLPLAKLSRMKTGGVLSRFTGDIDVTTELLHMALMSPCMSMVRLLFATVVLTSLNWRLAMVALAVIPGAMVISFIWVRRVRPIYRSIREDAERMDGRVGESISGIRVVRAFGREMFELLCYMRDRHTVVRKELFARRHELVVWASWNVLLGVINVAIVWYGGDLNLHGKASVGDIMAFQWYTFMLLNPVWNIVNTVSEMQCSLAAMERVFEVLAMEHDTPDRPDARSAPSIVDEIRFDNVEFEYEEARPVVRKFCVYVPRGSMVALVGRSGAGKTTVMDLLARFHDPTRGRILLNGCDIRCLRLHSYRNLLAIVQQEVFLFDGSVRDNIAYSRCDATDAEVEDAARRANAHEFILTLAERYDTLIGERGVKLSGGQQQRIAIARAFLASPQILILDEATSNLDTESEQLIQRSMVALFAGRIAFVIAHRLSTVRRADLILVMEEGRIIEHGTHDNLMRACGVYHDMVTYQCSASFGDEAFSLSNSYKAVGA
jgi:ATP-binding cassette subfamily B protein